MKPGLGGATIKLSGETKPALAALRAAMSSYDIDRADFYSSNGRLTCVIHCLEVDVDSVLEMTNRARVEARTVPGDRQATHPDGLDMAHAGAAHIREAARGLGRFGRDSLRILPSSAFGTGHHPTTQSCLELVSHLVKSRKRFRDALDFGCGSGIVGVYVAKQIQCPVTFVDRADVARAATISNLRANRIRVPHLRVAKSLAGFRSRRFDLVISNLNVRDHQRSIARLAAAVRPGGVLILGGLATGRCDLIWRLCRKFGLKPMLSMTRGTWTTVQLRRERGLAART